MSDYAEGTGSDQGAPAPAPYVIFRPAPPDDDQPFVVHVEDDGVTYISPLRVVPDIMFHSPALWDAPIPGWMPLDGKPPMIFISLAVELNGRRRDAVSELWIAHHAAHEVESMIANGACTAGILAMLGMLQDSVKAALKRLDQR